MAARSANDSKTFAHPPKKRMRDAVVLLWLVVVLCRGGEAQQTELAMVHETLGCGHRLVGFFYMDRRALSVLAHIRNRLAGRAPPSLVLS